MKNKIIYILVAVLLVVVAAFTIISNNQKTNTDNTNSVLFKEEIFTIEVVATKGEVAKYPFASLNDETLEQTLDIAMEDNLFSYTKTVSDFGSFVTSINDITADSTKEFWNIQINGVDSLVGISQINPNEGDIITFTLTQFN